MIGLSQRIATASREGTCMTADRARSRAVRWSEMSANIKVSGHICLIINGEAPMAKVAQKEVVSCLITQDHMAFLPATSGGVLLVVLWQNSV
jgi:hypothetical protein